MICIDSAFSRALVGVVVRMGVRAGMRNIGGACAKSTSVTEKKTGYQKTKDIHQANAEVSDNNIHEAVASSKANKNGGSNNSLACPSSNKGLRFPLADVGLRRGPR